MSRQEAHRHIPDGYFYRGQLTQFVLLTVLVFGTIWLLDWPRLPNDLLFGYIWQPLGYHSDCGWATPSILCLVRLAIRVDRWQRGALIERAWVSTLSARVSDFSAFTAAGNCWPGNCRSGFGRTALAASLGSTVARPPSPLLTRCIRSRGISASSEQLAGDHFFQKYREGFVKGGSFKYIPNSMYVFGLFGLVLIGLWLDSTAAIITAMFSLFGHLGPLLLHREARYHHFIRN